MEAEYEELTPLIRNLLALYYTAQTAHLTGNSACAFGEDLECIVLVVPRSFPTSILAFISVGLPAQAFNPLPTFTRTPVHIWGSWEEFLVQHVLLHIPACMSPLLWLPPQSSHLRVTPGVL